MICGKSSQVRKDTTFYLKCVNIVLADSRKITILNHMLAYIRLCMCIYVKDKDVCA
jgi:hypothetical protein